MRPSGRALLTLLLLHAAIFAVGVIALAAAGEAGAFAIVVFAAGLATASAVGFALMTIGQRTQIGRGQDLEQALDHAAALEAEAREAFSRLSAALDGIGDAVLALDATAGVAFANRAAVRLLSSDGSALTGKAFGWVLPHEDAVGALRAAQAAGAAQSRMIELSDHRHMRLDIAPIDGGTPGGSDWATLVTLADLTDLYRTDQVRRDFVANVSHELRTPLASIKAVIETLESGGLADETAARDFLGRANNEVDRLVQLVEELLELSRIESGVPIAAELLDLGPVVARAAERLRPQAERQALLLSVIIDPNLPRVTAGNERIERVVINLVQNAINFTQEGGSITVRAQRAGGAVAVSVSDTGVGIAPEDQARVFERFYKVDRARGARGTGLGLAIVKHAIEAHGGTVRLESGLGQGSTFTFTLPAAG